MRLALVVAAVVAPALLNTSAAAAQTGCGLSDPDDDRIVITGGSVVGAAETAGDVLVVDGDVRIAGRVAGDVVAVAGDVRVSGCVGGDLTTLAGRATVLPTARVGGDLVYADENPSVAPRAELDGEIREEDWSDIDGGAWGIVGAAALWLAVTISLLVSGIVLVALLPEAMAAAHRAARSQLGLTVGIGLAAAIGLPLLAIAALLTLLGIPLGIVVLLALLPLAWLGYLTASFVLGRRILADRHPLLAFLVGLGILRAVALIPVLGLLVWIPAVIIGLGSLVVAARTARSPREASA